MNKKLLLLFPLLGTFCSEDGISLTQANQKKNENTNKVKFLFSKIEGLSLFNTETTVIGTNTDNRNTTKCRIVVPADFGVLQQISKLNAENAILGNGIKIINNVRTKLEGLENKQLLDNYQEVVIPVLESLESDNYLRHCLNLDRVEEILQYIPIEVAQEIGNDNILKALGIEAECAVIGNQITRESSFLRIIQNIPVIEPEFKEMSIGIIKTEKILAYTEKEIEEFIKLFNDLEKHYSNIQGQLNGLKKIMRDTIRKHIARITLANQEKNQNYNNSLKAARELITQQEKDAEVIRQQLLTELSNLKIKVN